MTRLLSIVMVLGFVAIGTHGQAPNLGYDDTPMQPNGKWRIHDGHRPQPSKVSPGATSSQPPSDAVVLLGPDNDLSRWRMQDGSPLSWKVEGGVLESAKGSI